MERKRTNNFTRKLALSRAESFVEDGAETTIKCSNCGTSLITVWVIRPDAPMSSSITVECPHCGDKSFRFDVRGQYCIGSVEGTEMVDAPTKTEVNDKGRLIQTVTIQCEKG